MDEEPEADISAEESDVPNLSNPTVQEDQTFFHSGMSRCGGHTVASSNYAMYASSQSLAQSMFPRFANFRG
jgi:hypothetical protein